ncbi:hypothetical protein HPB49_016380 [Dermacentor silvarum]|uniref:Uncharacterized protein n=1 Tax=Dermacentor silvarum TaxID=543639 RepID=A0ACB8DPQ9_DERSI|nr:uncharacterized protein LOC119430959 [Dermacentor silvarum]KAH7974517.1 hypothetical protein HPB49_016380 [Dermacentor silvarum]
MTASLSSRRLPVHLPVTVALSFDRAPVWRRRAFITAGQSRFKRRHSSARRHQWTMVMSATVASAASVTVFLLALCGTDARFDVLLFPRRRPQMCFADPLSPRLGDRASCPFRRSVNVQAGRIPADVPTVRCKCPGSRCSQLGDFRCQEIREILQVAYVEGDGPAVFRNETFTVACACVTSRTGQGASDRLTRVADQTSYGKVRGLWKKYAGRPYSRLRGLLDAQTAVTNAGAAPK